MILKVRKKNRSNTQLMWAVRSIGRLVTYGDASSRVTGGRNMLIALICGTYIVLYETQNILSDTLRTT